MGRRAKNKQPAPEPLQERSSLPDKKLGKRKQEPDQDTRPAKKVKAKENAPLKTAQNKSVKDKKRKDKKASESEGEGSGWDDVDDEEDIIEEKRYIT